MTCWWPYVELILLRQWLGGSAGPRLLQTHLEALVATRCPGKLGWCQPPEGRLSKGWGGLWGHHCRSRRHRRPRRLPPPLPSLPPFQRCPSRCLASLFWHRRTWVDLQGAKILNLIVWWTPANMEYFWTSNVCSKTHSLFHIFLHAKQGIFFWCYCGKNFTCEKQPKGRWISRLCRICGIFWHFYNVFWLFSACSWDAVIKKAIYYKGQSIRYAKGTHYIQYTRVLVYCHWRMWLCKF